MENVSVKYSYRVAWSDEDEAFVARCSELQGVAAHGPTAADAMRSVMEAASGAVECMLEDGEQPPAPLANYSGRFVVRIPPQLHRELAAEASLQQVSMNRLIATKLAAAPARSRRKL